MAISSELTLALGELEKHLRERWSLRAVNQASVNKIPASRTSVNKIPASRTQERSIVGRIRALLGR